MKKFFIWILCVLFLLALSGCECRHAWTDATCTAPKTCSKCGVTEGETLWHNWKEATCNDPRTCANCGITEGSKLGHDWELATCEKASTCKVCGTVEGLPLGHFPGNWERTSLDTERLLTVYKQRCTKCNAVTDTRSEALTSFTEKNLFLLTPNQLTQRFAAICKTNGLELNYSFTNSGVGAAAVTEWGESAIVVQFLKDDASAVSMSELESAVAWAASFVSMGQVDANAPLYFMMTCDPSLDMDGAAALYQQIQDLYDASEFMLQHVHNNMLYQYMILPISDLGVSGEMVMLNIYASATME